MGRLMLALDHLRYGVVVAGRLAPEKRCRFSFPRPSLRAAAQVLAR
jgi:hypothetical protein